MKSVQREDNFNQRTFFHVDDPKKSPLKYGERNITTEVIGKATMICKVRGFDRVTQGN